MNEHRHETADEAAAADAGLRLSHVDERTTAETDLLLARAKEFAREQPVGDGEDGTSIEVLEFSLAAETHAFELAYVREVGTLIELTPLPGVPNFILGVTCVHGQIIAVLDLRKVFGLPERGLSNSQQVIILQSDEMEFGILAEHVAGVRRLPLAELQPSLPTLTDVRAAYLEGLAPDGTVVLSAAKLLADPQLVVQQNV
jgi:purine-binding chemotaxis protein CheW